MRATRALVYATAAASPAYLQTMQVGPISTMLLEVLTALVVVAFTIESLVTTVRPRWPGAFTGPLAVIAIAMAGSIALSVHPGEAAGAARTLFLEPAVIFGIACSVMVTAQHLRRLAGALLLGGGLLAVADLITVAAAVAPHPELLFHPPVARVGLGDSTLLVPLAALALALLISTQGQRSEPRRLPAALYLLVALPAAALSLGRSSWLTLAMVAAAIAAAYVRRRLVLVGVIIAGALALTVAPIHASIGEVSSNSRDAALQMWTNTAGAPGPALGGSGAVQFGLVAEIGLAGLFGFAWFGIRVWRWVIACAHCAKREHRALAVGGGVAIGAVLVRGLLEQRLLGDELGMMAAFGGIILVTVARIERIRLRAFGHLPWTAPDIEPAELPMPADIPRKTGRYPVAPAIAEGPAADHGAEAGVHQH